MSFSKDSLPVYTADRELLYYAPLASVAHLIENGKVRPVGTRRRMRALIAICGKHELLRAAHIPTGQRYSHNHETDDNPQGVWTFSKRVFARHDLTDAA
ncbi:MAG: hypothetical protein C5B60_05385 [Chloroflexi bacterium]|nr:MAG: hypothetical protein C5B60_05385 [Chloroflexota bacterium]